MKTNDQLEVEIVGHEKLTEGIYEMVIQCPSITKLAKAGQFINMYLTGGEQLLPRPISICEIDQVAGHLHLVYKVLGKGTEAFSHYQVGDKIKIMGPLGNGFDTSDTGEHLLIAGGVGTPPMVELAKSLKGNKIIVLGFRTDVFLVERLRKYGQVYVATDDGSVGFKGNVVALIEEKQLKGRIYACGPTPMLKAVQKYAQEKELEAVLSLEERMGCGFGACVGCVTKIKAKTEEGFIYKRVCKDGPVFSAKEVLFT